MRFSIEYYEIEYWVLWDWVLWDWVLTSIKLLWDWETTHPMPQGAPERRGFCQPLWGREGGVPSFETAGISFTTLWGQGGVSVECGRRLTQQNQEINPSFCHSRWGVSSRLKNSQLESISPALEPLSFDLFRVPLDFPRHQWLAPLSLFSVNSHLKVEDHHTNLSWPQVPCCWT